LIAARMTLPSGLVDAIRNKVPAALVDANDLVDRMHEKMVWTHKGMTTYQRNERGRVVFLTPFLNIEYWEMLAEPKLEDYVAG